ncbi:MAG TPA: hypothetical protein PK843_07540 [bacterium]|nr:hypothetical protein [bacterium]
MKNTTFPLYILSWLSTAWIHATLIHAHPAIPVLTLPDQEIVRAFEKAAGQNVLAAVNDSVFFGYFSVCADGQGFGYANTYPSLDGHQMSDALLWLGESAIVKANWDYVLTFQKPDGSLPLAILPAQAGRTIGPPAAQAAVEANGGLYHHWVPGDPLRALAGPTLIQNADVIYRFTQDRIWLIKQLPAVNRSAEYLAALTTAEGAVAGAGYYIERPCRQEYDGVAQCHAVDAFRRLAQLNREIGAQATAQRFQNLAERSKIYFCSRFWQKDHFAEYIHPQHGLIDRHGLTDVNWCALALSLADRRQAALLWPLLKNEYRFYYGGMPSGIATLPGSYEAWEFTFPDQMDLAAMGRVWYLEAWARANMQDGPGLLNSILAVCREGEKNGYYWRERYQEQGGYGAQQYCEYPANLIRIVERFLLGVDLQLDGSLRLAPTVPDHWWIQGFGQTIGLQDWHLQYRMQQDQISGRFSGESDRTLWIRLPEHLTNKKWSAQLQGRPVKLKQVGNTLCLTLPKTDRLASIRFAITAHG